MRLRRIWHNGANTFVTDKQSCHESSEVESYFVRCTNLQDESSGNDPEILRIRQAGREFRFPTRIIWSDDDTNWLHKLIVYMDDTKNVTWKGKFNPLLHIGTYREINLNFSLQRLKNYEHKCIIKKRKICLKNHATGNAYGYAYEDMLKLFRWLIKRYSIWLNSRWLSKQAFISVVITLTEFTYWQIEFPYICGSNSCVLFEEEQKILMEMDPYLQQTKIEINRMEYYI